MKLLKSLTLGVMLAATVSSASAAPTIVHVVGSTAFRSATCAAIVDTLAGVSPSAGTTATKTVYACASNKSILTGAEQVFADGTIGSGGTATTIVVTSWTGSLAGVVDLTVGVSQVPFLDVTNANVIAAVNNNTVTSTYGTAAVVNGGAAAVIPGLSPSSTTGTFVLGGTDQTSTNDAVQLALSDSYQGTIKAELATGTLSGTLGTSGVSPYGTFTGAAGLKSLSSDIGNTSDVTYAGNSGYAAKQDAIGVVPFVWAVGNNTGITQPTNISQQAAKQLLTAGGIPLALLAGTNDNTNYFYLIGRNEDSGTRIGAMAESAFGVTNPPTQYQINDSAASPSGSITDVTEFPVTALATESQISWGTAGHSGYAAGGNVAACLGLANSGFPSTSFSDGSELTDPENAYFIGYVGLTDAVGIAGSNSLILSYNGVACSPAAVENGSYSFWTYEHAYRLPTLSGTALTVVNNIADNVYKTDADVVVDSTNTVVGHAGTSSTPVTIGSSTSAGYLLSNMKVSRNVEGAVIGHK